MSTPVLTEEYTISIYIFHFYIMYHKCDSNVCIYLYYICLYYISFLYIIYYYNRYQNQLATHGPPYRPVPARTGPYRSLQGLRQHFHVAVLELVALVDRHTDAWWDRKPLGRCGRWSERDVLKNN